MNEEIVETFIGRVNDVHGDAAFVTLMHERSSERIDGQRERVETQCSFDLLSKSGISVYDEFKCEIVRIDGGQAVFRLTKLAPNPISESELIKINQEVDSILF